MPKKIKRLFTFTSTPSKAGVTAGQNMPPANPILPSLYLSSDTLPLDRFIRCVCDDDLSALVIKEADIATVDIEDLLKAWDNIYLEYIDASADNDTRYKMTLEARIAIFGSRLQRATILIEQILQFFYVPVAMEELRTIPLFEDATLTPEAGTSEYFNGLNRLKSRSSEIRIDKELMEIELNELKATEDKSPSKKADKASFLNILSRIATYKKVAVIRTSEITVAEFCAMFREYLDYTDAIKTRKK